MLVRWKGRTHPSQACRSRSTTRARAPRAAGQSAVPAGQASPSAGAPATCRVLRKVHRCRLRSSLHLSCSHCLPNARGGRPFRLTSPMQENQQVRVDAIGRGRVRELEVLVLLEDARDGLGCRLWLSRRGWSALCVERDLFDHARDNRSRKGRSQRPADWTSRAVLSRAQDRLFGEIVL